MLALPVGALPLEQVPHAARADFSVRFLADGSWVRYTVFLRKGVREFLKRAAEEFELVLFTAATRLYASPIIDALEAGS